MAEIESPSWLKALPQAPEYHPTEAEFADPVTYILKIEEEAKQYGICKIIPPYTKASKKVVVNNLNRSLSMSTDALSSVVHGSSAPLSRSMGGVMVSSELSKTKGLFLDASCTDSSNKAKFATRRQQLGWNPKRARGVAHSQNHKLVWQSGESYTLEQFEMKAKMFSRSRLGTWKDVSPLAVESLFWRAAAEKPISVEYANDIPGSAFSDPAEARFRKRKRALEDAEQVNLADIFVGCQNDEKVQDEDTFEEFDPSEGGKPKNNGLETGGDNVGGAGSKLANSAWNMRNVARSQGSLLRFMPEEVPGVTSPMVYIGMLFSWFAWHVEDHELHSLNYLHMGASKTWYAVPGDAAPALEEAIRVHGYGGHLDPRGAFSLLGEKTTVMSPEVLVAAGVPCCRLVQNAGEYVVTFPRAYHLGFSHGFNCGEAANFATPGWLEVAKEAAARRAAMNYLPMLSHQQLLYLLAMSLPPRMLASSPSEPRSSRLKVRKKSAGEEMVKSVFLKDAVQNNAFLRILLDNGVSRCLLAKDAVHRTAPKVISEGPKQRSAIVPFEVSDSLEPALVSEGNPQGDEASHFLCHAEATVDTQLTELSSCTPVPSVGHDADFDDLSLGSFGEIKLSCRSTDPSAASIKSATEGAAREFDGNPIRSNSQKDTKALAIDWGTLPCAACGILCYATMAVVEPSVSAAMTFKPIYAAAGLGHCAFEAHEAGRMTKYIPPLSYPRSSPVAEVNDEQPVNSFQTASADGRAKHDGQPGMMGEFPNPTFRQPVPGEVVSTKQARHPGHSSLQTFNKCMDPEIQMGRVTALINMESNALRKSCNTQALLTDAEWLCQEELGVHVDCGNKLGLTTFDAERLRSRNLDSYIAFSDWKDSYRTMYPTPPEPLAPLSLCKTADAKVMASVREYPQECSLQPRHTDKFSCVRNDRSPDVAEICIEKERQHRVLPPLREGISSLQLLASTYDESSDLEEENTIEAAEDCDVFTEDQNCVDEGAEGCEVFAKPHSGVGDLLTDVIGVSADVPWLSLVPVTEPVDLPPLTSRAPLFTFSSLVEGPQSLKKVFISGGFSFRECDDTADPASLGSSLTEERSGKQSSEVGSVDGDLNNQASDVNCRDKGKVLDMQELYHRINSQALTVDSDEDEQLLIDFGLRRSRATCLHESLDVEDCKNDSTEQVPSILQLEAKNQPQVFKHLNVASDVPSYGSLAAGNPSCPAPNYLETAAESLYKENDTSQATAMAIQMAGVNRLCEDSCVGGRMSITSTQDGVAGSQQKHHIPETAPPLSDEWKLAGSQGSESVARPRVLCLEHAVEAQERLRSVGGAKILIVCHSDFDNYELRAKQLTPEFGLEHTWRHIPFTDGTNEEVRMVNTAVDVDDDGRKVNDWVMQMGLFVHHRFKERESESSDDGQNPNEDFRAGPFSGVKQGKLSRNRLMGARLGLSRKSGVSKQITVRYSRRLPAMSKKKKCMVVGKWCGKVWRVNQVHPLLGGCRTVDPSLQLGMPSTSLYAMSLMSECDGGKYRRGISSSRIEASSNGHLIPDKNADDQSIAVRNRGRKRKALDQGVNGQEDNVTGGQRKVAALPKSSSKNTLAVYTADLDSGDCSSSPKHGLLAESRDGSECLDGSINGVDEVFNGGECQGQLVQVSPNVVTHSDADLAVQSSRSDITSPWGSHMISPIPLAARNPQDTDNRINGSNGKSIETIGEHCAAIEKHSPASEMVGDEECHGSFDKMKTVGSPSLLLPSESQQAADVNTFQFNFGPAPLSFKTIQTESGQTVEVEDWHKTSSLSNVYSALPLSERAVKIRNEANSSLVVKSTSVGGNRMCGVGSAPSCVWRDVPLICAPSFHPLSTPLTVEFSSPLTNGIPSHLSIPYVSVSTEAVSSHTQVSQNSHSELYSGSSKNFGSCEQGGKLHDVHLVQQQAVGHVREGGIAGADHDSQFPKLSFKSTPGTPTSYTDIDTSVQHMASSKLLAANGEQGPQRKSVFLGDDGLSSMNASVPSSVNRVMESYLGPNEEDCRGGSCETHDLSQGVSEQLVCESGGLQRSLQDIKNVVFRLSDAREKFTAEAAQGLLNSDLRAHHTDLGQSTSNDSDPVRLQETRHQNCLMFDGKGSIELTPVLSITPSFMEDGALVGSGQLGFADALGQVGALEHPLENLLPLRTSSRGRSAVKARGKRPKHVGWTNYKPAQSWTPGETSVNNWSQKPQSLLGAPVIFTLQPKECVEARFEAEDCDRVLEILDQTASPTGPSSLGLKQLTAGENCEPDENDEDDCEPEKKVVKPRKKAKPKRKRVPVGKPAIEDGEFHCDIDGCRMSFPTDSDLQIHKRNRCTFKGCGKRFFMHKYLLQHRRVHLDERPLKCPWKGCKQAFKWAWARTEHIRVHTGERPYACPDCDQTFRFVSDFSRHKRNTGHTKS